MTLVTEAAPQEPAPRAPRGRLKPLVMLLALVIVAGGAYAVTSAPDAERHDHSTHSHEPDLNPCTLVSEADMEAVVGAVSEPIEGGVGVVDDQRVCTTHLERDARISANIGFTDFDAESKYRGFAGPLPAEGLPDLGDEAVWIATVRLAMVRVDDGLITVQVSDVFVEPADTRDKAIRLATLAVNGLSNAERD